MLNNSLSSGGYYNFSPYELSYPDLNFESPSICSMSEGEDLAIEIFRIGWVISFSIENKLRDGIGSGFLASQWLNDPAWGSRQDSFNQIGKKVADFAVCSAKGFFLNIQRGWSYLENSLKKEKSADQLRDTVIHNSLDLGEFSDTPLIVSEEQLNFPNVVTFQEFEKIRKLYESIRRGFTGIKIEGSYGFIEFVLKDLRIILSTVVGRELMYSLCEKRLSIREEEEGEEPQYLSEKGEIVLKKINGGRLTFGAPDSDKINALEFVVTTLFHELTHAYHDLVAKDIEKYSDQKVSHLWSNGEELRTIIKTNEFRRQLKEGEENWYGRCYHHVLKADSIEQKIKYLLAYHFRLDEKIPAADSIKEFYPTILKNFNLYLPSMAKGGHYDLIQSVVESTSLEDIDFQALAKALYNAFFEGYEEIFKLILNSFEIEHLILNFKNEHFNTILNYFMSNKDEATALLFIHSDKFFDLSADEIPGILINAIDHELNSVIVAIIQRLELGLKSRKFYIEYLAPIFDIFSSSKDEKLLKILFDNFNFEKLSNGQLVDYGQLQIPFESSGFEKKGNIIELVINNGSLNLGDPSRVVEMGSGALLRLATLYGDVESVQFILRTKLRELTIDDLGKSFYLSTYRKDNKVFQLLLESPFFNEILSQDLSAALTNAYEANNKDVVCSLLHSNRLKDIGANQLRKIMEDAYKKGNLKLAQLILNSEQFEKILDLILQFYFFDPEELPFMDLFQMILKSDRIKEVQDSYFQRALLIAKQADHPLIEEILQDHLNKKH